MSGYEYVWIDNEETLLIAQIEDGEAVDKADGIAAVEGIDVLFRGFEFSLGSKQMIC